MEIRKFYLKNVLDGSERSGIGFYEDVFYFVRTQQLYPEGASSGACTQQRYARFLVGT